MAKNKGNNRGQDDFAKFARKTETAVDEARPTEVVEGGDRPVVQDTGGRVESDSTEFEIDAEVADVVAVPPAPAPVPEPTAEHLTFITGRELPPVVPKEGVHPLLVKCYQTFRRLRAGGLITPWAVLETDRVDSLMAELKKEVEGESG